MSDAVMFVVLLIGLWVVGAAVVATRLCRGVKSSDEYESLVRHEAYTQDPDHT